MGKKILLLTTGIDLGRLRTVELFAAKEDHQVTIWRFTTWWWGAKTATRVEVVESVMWGFKLPFGCVSDDLYVHLDLRVVYLVLRRTWDVVILYGYGSFTTLITTLAARARGIPVVLWSDARIDYEMTRRAPYRIYKSLLHRLANRLVASGTAARKFLEKTAGAGHRIPIAPYAIENEAFLAQLASWIPAASKTRQDLGIGPATVTLLYVGRLVRPKGVEELLCAYQKVRRSVSESALVLVGDGEDGDYFRGVASQLGLSDVHFVGAVPYDRVAQYYAISDVFVLPSHRDVWAKVVNEACLAGLPLVVTADVGAHYDLVLQGQNGFVVSTHDVDALAEPLIRLCQNAEIRQEMGRRSREVIRKWTMEAAANVLGDVIKGVGTEQAPCPPGTRLLHKA